MSQAQTPSQPPPLSPHQSSPQGSSPGWLRLLEALLRRPEDLWSVLKSPDAPRAIVALLLGAFGCALLYGLIVGSFSGGTQWWASPLKIAGGLMISAVICLPSLYIFACLGGARTSFKEVVGLLAALLALMTLLLAGFAPVAWIFSQSTESLVWMGCLHWSFWLTAAVFAFRLFDAGFNALGSSGTGLKAWMVIFVVVVLQMSSALRPLLGSSDSLLPKEKRFFLDHWGTSMR